MIDELKLSEEIAKIEQVYAELESDRALALSLAPYPTALNMNNLSPSLPSDKIAKVNNSIDESKEKFDLLKQTKTPIVVDYWPSWSSNWTRDDLRNTPDSVSVINIAFALPDGRGSLTWKDDIHPACTKQVITELQKRNKIVLLSVGGATAQNWNLSKIDLPTFAKNIKSMIDNYGLNGVDIDYEQPTDRDILTQLIKELRKIMPIGKYWISYAAWSIGAYGIKGHEHPEWDNNHTKGMDIPVLSKIGDLLDWVNVMSYDAFDPSIRPPYNPTQAIAAFKDLLGNRPDKVLLGILIGKHSWPQNVLTTTKQVEGWMDYTIKQKYRGFMFWMLQKDTHQETGELTGSFTKMTERLITKPNHSSNSNLSKS